MPVRRFGIPEQFLAHAKRAEVLADIGLTPVEIAGRISAGLAVREARSKAAHELSKAADVPAEHGVQGEEGMTDPAQKGSSTSARSSPSAEPSATSCTRST